MTQNDVNFLQEALGVKCAQLLEEIVANHNFAQKANSAPTANVVEPKKPKKQKENK